MSSTVEDYAKNFAVDSLGMTREQFKLAWNAGVVLVMLETGNIGLASFLDFSDGPETSSIEAKLDQIAAELAAIKEAVDNSSYKIILQTVVKENAHKIALAVPVVRTFRTSPSVPSRVALSHFVDEAEGLSDALIELLDPKFPFIAMRHSKPAPEWANGRWTYFSNYQGPDSNTWPGAFKAQVYQQLTNPLDTVWSLPEPLQKESGDPLEEHWDGLLSLPVVLYGLPLWLEARMLLEPFYRLSGHWNDHIDLIVQAMDKFQAGWGGSQVWTREMPSLQVITQPLTQLSEAVVGGGSYSPEMFPEQGFYEYPCGVLDPVLGIEIINKTWWTKDGYSPEMMTDQQRNQFKQLRFDQLVKLQQETGFSKFIEIRSSLASLKKPPVISPSLGIHPEHLHVTRPFKKGTFKQAELEDVTDPGGTVWTGSVARSSVTVKAPISVQPNFYAGKDTMRRAESEIMFGYDISVTPVGGTKQTLLDWHWPLSLSGLDPPTTSKYRDLYHGKNGEILIQDKPYDAPPTPHKFSAKASTWKTVTDGKHRDKIDVKVDGTVAFSMTVTVNDQLPTGMFPIDESDPEQVFWKRQHGVIGVTIEADMDENNGRSFEVIIEVTETAAVDKNGHRKGTDGFQGSKAYTVTMPMPVDIYQISVPKGYFDWLVRSLEKFRHISQRIGIPGPHPEPDAVLELSLWRIVLEKNPTFLQEYMHELRRITGRPFVMPHQALAELDAAVIKLGAGPMAGQFPGIRSNLSRETIGTADTFSG
jgi:hypothetical protein